MHSFVQLCMSGIERKRPSMIDLDLWDIVHLIRGNIGFFGQMRPGSLIESIQNFFILVKHHSVLLSHNCALPSIVRFELDFWIGRLRSIRRLNRIPSAEERIGLFHGVEIHRRAWANRVVVSMHQSFLFSLLKRDTSSVVVCEVSWLRLLSYFVESWGINFSEHAWRQVGAIRLISVYQRLLELVLVKFNAWIFEFCLVLWLLNSL